MGNAHTTAASLIVGAFHVARGANGGQSNGVLHKEAYPLPEQLEKVTETNPEVLLKQLDDAIRAKDQYGCCAIATRYAQNGGQPARTSTCCCVMPRAKTPPCTPRSITAR